MISYLQAGETRYNSMPYPPLWRVKHDIERGALWRPDLPEVFRLKPDHSILLDPARQWLWKNINPKLSRENWRKLLGNTLAFTNGTGFPGHADYVNGLEMGSGLPRMDQARICGGAVVTGKVIGDKLWVAGVDTRKPLPSAEYVMRRRWLYFYNVTARASGNIGRFPQGDGIDTFTPLFMSTDCYLLLSDLVKINGIPSPYKEFG